MSQKHIMILSQYPLFDQGLRAALGQHPAVEIVGVYRDLDSAYSQAKSMRPHVLLLIAGPEIVRSSTFRLLEEVCSSIIRISPTDGTMRVYRRHQVDQATVDDLMTAIQATAIQWQAGEGTDTEPSESVSK